MTEGQQPTAGADDQALDLTQSKSFALAIARLLSDSHCEEVRVLDVQSLTEVTDYLVIATGTSDRQIRSLSDDVKKFGRENGHPMFQRSGAETADWLVADFVDMVVHLFEDQTRVYYDLESLWGDATEIDWQAVTRPGQFS